jgi:hypothetical protein
MTHQDRSAVLPSASTPTRHRLRDLCSISFWSDCDSLDLFAIHLIHGEHRFSVGRHQNKAPKISSELEHWEAQPAYLLRPILSSWDRRIECSTIPNSVKRALNCTLLSARSMHDKRHNSLLGKVQRKTHDIEVPRQRSTRVKVPVPQTPMIGSRACQRAEHRSGGDGSCSPEPMILDNRPWRGGSSGLRGTRVRYSDRGGWSLLDLGLGTRPEGRKGDFSSGIGGHPSRLSGDSGHGADCQLSIRGRRLK